MRLAFLSTLALGVAAPAIMSAQPAPPTAAANPVVTTVAPNINITPKRLTLYRNRRNATLFVINQGDAQVTVDISLVDRVMTPDGQILAVEDAAKRPALGDEISQLKSAKEMLQLSPRRVTLDPGKGQTIRIRLADIPAGATAPEYRTHLTVTSVPPRDTGTTAESVVARGGARELSFRVTAVYGVSIPVIVRTQPVQGPAELTNMRVETLDSPASPGVPARKVPVLAVDVKHSGGSSLYGVFEVRSENQKRGEEPLGIARGVGVYPEIDHRTVRIPLKREPRPGEKLDVTFTDDDASPGKVLAKSTL